MSEWKQRVDALVEQMGAALGTERHDELQAESLAIVNERLDAEDLRNKVWMVMPYRCDAQTACGSIQWYECEVGVEGPPSWREDGTYLASPFTAGRCRRCGAPMTHKMHNDFVFDSPVDPGTEFVGLGGMPLRAQRYFRVPREPVTYVTEGCREDGSVIYSTAVHAFLSTPMHALVGGR